MKNYKNHIKSKFALIWKNNANEYGAAVIAAQKYLTDNRIVYEQTGYFGSSDLRISFQNKCDMMLFLVLYGDKWEKTK